MTLIHTLIALAIPLFHVLLKLDVKSLEIA